MVDAISRAAEHRTGLYTSPHLVTFRERIRLNGDMITVEAIAQRLTDIRELCAGWDPHPTFFEITTALALRYFQDEGCAVVVLETGLGGRLDATNVMQPNASVITPISIDHQKWLGATLREIATEKAGIIKPGVPVVSARQLPVVEEVIRSRAAECESPITWSNEPYEAAPISLFGSYQKQNAGIALAAVRAARIEASEHDVIHGLSNVEWPARFQKWNDKVVIDGAHNPAAAAILTQTWQESLGPERATVVLAVLSDKDLLGILAALRPITRRLILPHIQSERATPPADIVPVAQQIGAQDVHVVMDFAEAMTLASDNPERILITGSLHFAGEALAALRGEPAAFEECAQ
jgi:dihydrofolate synthase/folylpolyglutamate synthase